MRMDDAEAAERDRLHRVSFVRPQHQQMNSALSQEEVNK